MHTQGSAMPGRHKIVIGIMLSFLLGLGYWWYTNLEWEEKEIDLGYSKEAQQNHFLAAEIFLRKHGIQAITVKGQSLLDKHAWRNLKLGPQDTIVLINGYKILNHERYHALYEWINNGGTLITSTQNPFIGIHTDENDLLLDDLNIEPGRVAHDHDSRNPMEKFADEWEKAVEGEKARKKSARERNSTEKDSGNEESSADSSNTDKSTINAKAKKDEKTAVYYRCGRDLEPTLVKFTGEEKQLAFDFSATEPFIYDENSTSSDTDAEDESANKKRQEHMLYFQIGEGNVTITSDNFIWANYRIDCYDHAFALWQLVNADGRVWFLINQDAPSLLAILWRNASYGVIAALLALALWLWAKSQRFGPVFVYAKIGRRNLAEHIYAGAMLLWRQQQHPQLLKTLRSEILDRLDEQHPHLSQPQGDERIEFLHQLTGITPAAIKHALFADNLQHPQEFATAIAHLQTIRKQL
jgi:hypothetical protein